MLPIKDLSLLIRAAQQQITSAVKFSGAHTMHTLANLRNGEALADVLEGAKLQGILASAYGTLEGALRTLEALPAAYAAAEKFAQPVPCAGCGEVTAATPDGKCIRCGAELGGGVQ